MDSNTTSTDINKMFWLHLCLTSLAWIGPFLFSWPLMLIAYACVQIQYRIFNRCLMNNQHSFGEENDNTFYHYLLTKMGFQFDKKRIKFIVRQRLNYFLGLFAILWQWGLGFPALLF